MANESKILIDISKDEANRSNPEPIQEGCLNYSISYLFHLAEVKEMNYNILLAIHNMNVIDKLFENLR